MATWVTIQYGADFGGGDGSDFIEDEICLEGEAEQEYLRCKMFHCPLEGAALENALEDARPEIEDRELDNFLDMDDEQVREMQGLVEMDPDELTDLVHSGDAHAIACLGLEDMEEEELEEWDASELDELPLVRDAVAGFTPENPFDTIWNLILEYAEHPEEEDLEEDEARESLETLFRAVDPNTEDPYGEVWEYVNMLTDFYCGDDTLEALAQEVADGLGLEGFSVEDEEDCEDWE